MQKGAVTYLALGFLFCLSGILVGYLELTTLFELSWTDIESIYHILHWAIFLLLCLLALIQHLVFLSLSIYLFVLSGKAFLFYWQTRQHRDP